MSYLDSKFDFGRPFFECDTHDISVVKMVKSTLLASPRFLYKNEFKDVRFLESLCVILISRHLFNGTEPNILPTRGSTGMCTFSRFLLRFLAAILNPTIHSMLHWVLVVGPSDCRAVSGNSPIPSGSAKFMRALHCEIEGHQKSRVL